VEPGSSVSHWTKAATSPDLLMEPVLSAGLFSGTDLTDCLFKDIGWSVTSCSFAGVNQAPSVTASPSIGVTEDVQSNLTGISFSDPDAASGSLTAIFTVASGALKSPTCTGIGVSGSAAARTLQGTLTNLNACLAGNNLKFTTAQDATTSVLLSISINDNGNTGSGGAKMGMGSSMLTVSAVNDAPSIAAPGSIQVTEDAASNVTGISFADVDAGAGSLTATFGVGSGSLNSPACTGVTAGGTATARTLAGTLTNLNACLGGNNLKFTTASNTTTSVTLNVQLNDNGNTGSGGAKAATPVNVMLNVTAVNDAPTLNAITDPAPIPVSSGLQTINLSGISAGPNESQTLTVSAGSSNTGLIPNPSVTYISPNATGSIAYTPVAGQTGSAMVTVTVMDNGGTANGGVNQTSRVFNVSVGLIVNNIFSNGFETPTP
jgi:hypothetical protein